MDPPGLSRRAQLIRYLLVGGANTAFGYGSFAGLNYLLTGLIPYPYMAANLLANFAAITVAFLGYKHFVFRTKKNYLREYLRTFLVYGTATLFGLVLLPLLVFLLGFVIRNSTLVPYVAQAIATVLVVFSSFFGHKKYSFRSE